jgi:proteasome lid subunit RPN8/RPN11
MLYRVSKHQLKTLRLKAIHSADADGREICGLIIDNGSYLELLEVQNKVKRGGSFSFYVNEIRAVQKATILLHHEIVGTFHSHPYASAEPGKSDIEGTLDDALMLVFSCLDKNEVLWKIKDGKAKRLKIQLI